MIHKNFWLLELLTVHTDVYKETYIRTNKTEQNTHYSLSSLVQVIEFVDKTPQIPSIDKYATSEFTKF